jgi:hypothetical protein
MGFANRFISTHTRCLAVDRDEEGRMLMCGRSYGHDDPKAKKTPTDHYDPSAEVTWVSERAERARRKKEKSA